MADGWSDLGAEIRKEQTGDLLLDVGGQPA